MNTHNIQQQPALEISNLSVAYHHTWVLSNINCTIPTGTLVGIIGPNGGGKTTLIKTIMQDIVPTTGSAMIFGSSFAQAKKQVAYVPQRHGIDWTFPIQVLDVVLMGTYNHLGWITRPGKNEYKKAHDALNAVGLTSLAHTPISHLSGGQQQRTFLARALAQSAQLYILDEPFVGIDMTAERIIINVLKQLRDEGNTVIMVHHDLQTAHEYFDHILCLNKTVIAYGPTQDILVPEYMCATYENNAIFTIKKSL